MNEAWLFRICAVVKVALDVLVHSDTLQSETLRCTRLKYPTYSRNLFILCCFARPRVVWVSVEWFHALKVLHNFHQLSLHLLWITSLVAVVALLPLPGALLSSYPSKPCVKFIKRVSASRNTRFLLLDMMVAISRAASILLKSRKAGERVRASPSSLAAWASPVALIIVDLLS